MYREEDQRALAKPSLSIILPCHNEEEVIASTVATLDRLVARWLGDLISSCEYVLVNNGSTDRTIDIMRGLSSPVSSILIVDLRRNFGYQGSISGGLHHASNEVVVSIDADLQDDPEKIADMIREYRKGYDLVLGVRQDRSSDSFFKRTFTEYYYQLLGRMGVEQVHNHGEFRLLSRSLVEEFKKLSETNRYIRGLILQLDSRYSCVTYDRRARQAGTTKFSPGRLISLALDGITSFSSVPIRAVTIAGFLMACVAFLGLLYVLFFWLKNGRNVPGWASLATISFLFSGLQMLALGIVGEYIAKTYMESKRRPIFSVRRTYTLPKAPEPNRARPVEVTVQQ